jgi:hypothetical protein
LYHAVHAIMDEVWTTWELEYAPRYDGRMTTTPTKQDRRPELYTSIRINKKAYAALAERAGTERRTIIATLDILLGV